MKNLSNEARRLSLNATLIGAFQGHVREVDAKKGVAKQGVPFAPGQDQDLKDSRPSAPEEQPVAVNTKLEIGGKKKASKKGAMLWRPGGDSELAKLLVGPRMGQVATRESFEAKVAELVHVQRAYLADDGLSSGFDEKGFAKEAKSFQGLLEKDHALFKSLNAAPELEQEQIEARTRLLLDRWTKSGPSVHGTAADLDRLNERLEVLQAALHRALDDGPASRLAKAQNSFVEYRDQVSRFDAKLAGGSEPVRTAVATRMTLERIALLEGLLGQIEGGDGKALVLVQAKVALEAGSRPLPKAIERMQEVNLALKELGGGLGQDDAKALAADMEKLRSASIESSYLQWMHESPTGASRTGLEAGLSALREAASALLGRLDQMPGSNHGVKEGYARLLDVLSAIDGSLTRLAHGKDP